MRGSDWLLLWTLSLLWGGSFLFNELALAGLPALTVVWGRVGLAALILWGVMRATGAALPQRKIVAASSIMKDVASRTVVVSVSPCNRTAADQPMTKSTTPPIRKPRLAASVSCHLFMETSKRGQSTRVRTH